MEKKATIKEVAKKAGVSVSTVSRVLKNDPNLYIRTETKKRVVRAIRELGFKPDIRAQSLRGARTRIIGLIIPSLTPFYDQLVWELEDVCHSKEYGVLICDSNNDPKRERSYLDLLERQKVDSIVISTVGSNEERLRQLIKRGIPVILADEDIPGLNVPAIFAENYPGSCQATQYLIDLNHRRIAYISGPLRVLSGKERLRGYRDTLLENNLSFEKKLLKKGNYSYASGYKAAQALLRESKDKFTAIFCANDLMALGAIRAIQDTGGQVPEDSSVIGFDDIYFSSISYPQLTTIAQPVRKMAVKIFEAIKEEMEENLSRGEKRYRLSTRLVIRQSCRAV